MSTVKLAEQVATDRYKDADAYLAELIASDREDAEHHAKLKAPMGEGLVSGNSDKTVDDLF